MTRTTTSKLPAIAPHADGVHMRLYPNADLGVVVSRNVALHIFALVCRYNVARGRIWDRFWRGLEQVERNMTVLFVQANGEWGSVLRPEAMFGTTLWSSGLVDDFRAVAQSGRRIRLSDVIEQELEILYGGHVRSTVPPAQLLAVWATDFPQVYALLEQAGALSDLLENGRCFDSAQLVKVVESLLLADEVNVAHPVTGFTHAERCRNDARCFAACAGRLAMAGL